MWVKLVCVAVEANAQELQKAIAALTAHENAQQLMPCHAMHTTFTHTSAGK